MLTTQPPLTSIEKPRMRAPLGIETTGNVTSYSSGSG
jgi:hypothetical protein